MSLTIFTRTIFSSIKKNNILVCANSNIRLMSAKPAKLVYTDYGDPVKVVKYVDDDNLPRPKGCEVLIQMLAAPVNPADINTIQGKYPVKVTFPAVPGNEGVGEVLAKGPDVSNFEIGDRVIPLVSNYGTWNSHVIFQSKEIFKVPKELGIVEAATLTVNPCTAYRMLKDFVKLKPGDTVIQNGGNSAVGQMVIQLCRARGIKSVNIVRDRPEIEELKCFLKNLGATMVITEKELKTLKITDMPKPKLALNCIGGKNALEMTRQIDHSGVMVTYGGMSREPVTVPTSALIFKNLIFCGFWMTRWSKENAESEERWTMYNDLIGLMCDGKLHGPVHKMVPFSNYQEALMNTMSVQGFAGKKFILDFTNGKTCQ